MICCKKCGISSMHTFLHASVCLNAILCDECLGMFYDWHDTHPYEPVGNFIHPKPWEPKLPGLIRFILDDGETMTFIPPNFEWLELDEYFRYMADPA